MVIAFATQGLMTLPAAIAIMLGAELGTCADTLVASLGRSRAACKIGLFHLGFNLVAVILGLLLIEPFMAMVNALSTNSDLPRAVANAHLLFNVASVAILAGTAPWYRMLLDRLLPELAGRR